MKKNIYCTMDTETWGGATHPKGVYHMAGIIHDRQGNILATFNYLIAEHYEEIEKDSYAKRNFHKYLEMIENGITTMVSTEQLAVDSINELCDFYNVNYMTAYNSAFDFEKTICKQLIENREFIDIWLMALQTITSLKKYSTFCHDNNFVSASKKSCSTSAESVYAFITNQIDYKEEHTAFEDSKIEMEILLECFKKHKKFTRNEHCFNYHGYKCFPKW